MISRKPGAPDLADTRDGQLIAHFQAPTRVSIKRLKSTRPTIATGLILRSGAREPAKKLPSAKNVALPEQVQAHWKYEIGERDADDFALQHRRPCSCRKCQDRVDKYSRIKHTRLV